ncbi:MAG: sugar O-acyltransferase (sialic acid O-acetyltransferase NeuD family) [Bradymonadia bacterium]|jgi:sugar O-acyltransferase (sialic acid O-acetyltransferase NeuD family)
MIETTSLVILGASAFGEVASLIRDINDAAQRPVYEVIALLDDNAETHGSTVHGVHVSGQLSNWLDYPDAKFVFLIGSHRSRVIRRDIVTRLGIPRDRFVTLVHPTANVFGGASIGVGCLLYSGTVIFNDTAIEDFVLVLPNSVIGAFGTIAEFSLIASSVSVGSNVRIGPCVHIGAGAAVNEGVVLGAGSQVAMAGFCARNLPDGAFCIGNPAQAVSKIDIPEALAETWRNHPCREKA